MGVRWLLHNYIFNCHLLAIILYFSLSIDLILFVNNSRNLENCWDDWDEIWHENLGRVGVGFYIT